MTSEAAAVAAFGRDLDDVDPRVVALFGREQIPQRTEPWYEARRKLVTASEAAAVLEIKPFAGYKGSPRQHLLETKRNPKPFSNIFTEHGQKFEDEARDLYCSRSGEAVVEFGLIVHDTIPWLGCSVDGVTNTGKVVEIKCPLKREIKDGHVPEHYYPQVQVCMEVCNLDEAVFIQYKPECVTWPDPVEFSVTRVARDRDWFRRAFPVLEAFAKELASNGGGGGGDVPPAPAIQPAAVRAARRLPPRRLVECLIQEDLYDEAPAPVSADAELKKKVVSLEEC